MNKITCQASLIISNPKIYIFNLLTFNLKQNLNVSDNNMGGRSSTRSARDSCDSGINKNRQGGVSVRKMIKHKDREGKSVKNLVNFYNSFPMVIFIIEIHYILVRHTNA